MKKEECYENYPLGIVFFSNFVSTAIYLIGAFIIYKIGLIWLSVYLTYILILEFRLISSHCTQCYYYGKTCSFGKGRISKIFFKKGNPKNFCKLKLTWKDLLLDFMVSLIPIIIGAGLLIKEFNWTLLGLIFILIILTFFGNSLVRTKFACKYCKQRKLGCPTQKLFENKK